MMDLAQAIARGPVPIDGGLSNELERAGADLSGALWSARLLRDDPEAIVAAHAAYFEAGARVAITASYQTSFEGFAAHGVGPDEAAALMRRSVELARTAVASRRPFDVVCSDYQMPGMNGVELLHGMSQIEPAPSCILITGYVEVLRGSCAKASHIVGIIIKPYDPDELIGVVGRLGRVTQFRRSIDQMAGRVNARKS